MCLASFIREQEKRGSGLCCRVLEKCGEGDEREYWYRTRENHSERVEFRALAHYDSWQEVEAGMRRRSTLALPIPTQSSRSSFGF